MLQHYLVEQLEVWILDHLLVDGSELSLEVSVALLYLPAGHLVFVLENLEEIHEVEHVRVVLVVFRLGLRLGPQKKSSLKIMMQRSHDTGS